MSRRGRKPPAPPVQTGGRFARADSKRSRSDGYYNTQTSVGTSRDPSSYNQFCADRLHDTECRELYRGNAIAKKVVEYRVRAAFREGFEICSDDEKQSDEISAALRDLGADAAFRQAGFEENAGGGAAIFPVIRDGGDLSQPMIAGRMVKIESLLVIEARELRPVSFYRSVFDGLKFGMPRRYRFEPRNRGGAEERGQLIHESRLITFPGVRTARDHIGTNDGWGDSRLVRPNRVINQLGITWSGIASLLSRIEQGVYSVDKLTDSIREDGLDEVEGGLLDIDRRRSLLNMLVIDAKDKYERVGVPLAGLPETLQKMLLWLSSECEMPTAFLVGMSPTGLNSTGDAETRSWYDGVSEEQNDHFSPRVKQLAEMYCATNDSVTRGKIPSGLGVEWRPLWQPTEKEQAETNDTQAEADKKYFEMGVLPPRIIRRARFSAEGSSLRTVIDEKELKELEDLDVAVAQAELEAQQAAAEAVENTPADPDPDPDPDPDSDPKSEPKTDPED